MIGLVAEDDDANTACRAVVHEGQNQGNFSLEAPVIGNIKIPEDRLPDNLPRIDGVSYQQQKAKDGTLYITATGNVRNKNSILKEAGFKWNAGRKLWWKAA